MTTLALLIATLLLPFLVILWFLETNFAVLIATLLLPLIVILWFLETTSQRANRLRSNGWSQQRIADHMQISRYKVRMVLA